MRVTLEHELSMERDIPSTPSKRLGKSKSGFRGAGTPAGFLCSNQLNDMLEDSLLQKQRVNARLLAFWVRCVALLAEATDVCAV